MATKAATMTIALVARQMAPFIHLLIQPQRCIKNSERCSDVSKIKEAI